MSSPLVSICLPNLNTRPYLDERMETILGQSYGNWELIVSDNYSEDGAWEFFQSHARADRRIRISQAPRAGMYANWNNCIRQASGKYVYIATSDDTMGPDCLEKLVEALETNTQCDLAHCRLNTIDEEGCAFETSWYNRYPFVKSTQGLLDRPHVRLAPFDGLLHLVGRSVYISITQLLIRRSLFDRIGLFESRWGSMGDFNWNMRASLLANTVHVPDTWGGWRIHPEQATAEGAVDYSTRIQAMIEHAIRASRSSLVDPIRRPLMSSWGSYFADKRLCWTPGGAIRLQRLAHVALSLALGRRLAWDYLGWRLGRNSDWEAEPVQLVRLWYERCKLPGPFVPLGSFVGTSVMQAT